MRITEKLEAQTITNLWQDLSLSVTNYFHFDDVILFYTFNSFDIQKNVHSEENDTTCGYCYYLPNIYIHIYHILMAPMPSINITCAFEK